MSKELEPCPWPGCDGEAVHLVPQVVCNKCGRTAGCQVGSHQDNRDAWNTLPRAALADTLETVMVAEANHPLNDDERAIVDVEYERGIVDVEYERGKADLAKVLAESRELRLETAIFNAIGMLTLYTSPTDELAQAGIQSLHAALADTTNNDGG